MDRTFAALPPGSILRVRWGSKGSQVAVLEGPVTGSITRAWVRKYRANSGRWTNPVKIKLRAVLEVVNDEGLEIHDAMTEAEALA